MAENAAHEQVGAAVAELALKLATLTATTDQLQAELERQRLAMMLNSLAICMICAAVLIDHYKARSQ